MKYEELYTPEVLERAFARAMAGNRKNNECVWYKTHRLEAINTIRDQLIRRTYRPKPLRSFRVYEPKEREVQAPSISDKIVQNAMLDSGLYDALTTPFIRDTYGSMIGRGTLDGLDRMKQFMAQSWRIYGADCSVLKGDIHHFFASIDREDAARKARRQIEDDEVFDLFMRYLNNFDGGLPLGLRTSQPLANLVLNDMDHYIKESLGCRWYGRYMDDFYIIHPDRDFLKYARGEIGAGLSKIGLSLNNKTQIFPIQHGIDFLGFRTYMTDTGKVIRKVREQSRRGMGRRLRHFQDLYIAGVMTEEEIRMHYQCWRAHAEHGNSRGLILRYDAKVEKIFKGG